MYRIMNENLVLRLEDGSCIPLVEGNMDYEEYKQWLKDNTPEPEFTDEELAQQEQDKVNAEALKYLESTDWYVTRFIDTGVEIPELVKIAREEARARIVKE